MAKPANVLIKLVSTADTGFYYVTKKNPRNQTEKMEFRKYAPVARKHVLFKEGKIKFFHSIYSFSPKSSTKYKLPVIFKPVKLSSKYPKTQAIKIAEKKEGNDMPKEEKTLKNLSNKESL